MGVTTEPCVAGHWGIFVSVLLCTYVRHSLYLIHTLVKIHTIPIFSEIT